MARMDVPIKVQLGCDDCHRFLLTKTAEHKAEVERLKAKVIEHHDAAAKAYDALAPFRAVAEAMDDFGGFSDDEWLRLKPRLAGHINAARVALNERTA